MVSLIVLILTGFLALTTLADAQAHYRFQTIDVPCPGCTQTTVTGVTAQGGLLGTYNDAANGTHGFLWPHDGDFTTLLRVMPEAINPAGVIAGWFLNFGQTGFTFHEGTFRRIDVSQG